MKTLVVYDSFFGNTKELALEIGKISDEVKVVHVKEYQNDMLDSVELVVIASPTRAFNPTKDIKTFTKMIAKNATCKVAVFDTRVHVTEKEPGFLRFLVKRFGYAVDTMEKILKKSKKVTLMPSRWYYVGGTEGPIEEGELERIKTWIKEMK